MHVPTGFFLTREADASWHENSQSVHFPLVTANFVSRFFLLHALLFGNSPRLVSLTPRTPPWLPHDSAPIQNRLDVGSVGDPPATCTRPAVQGTGYRSRRSFAAETSTVLSADFDAPHSCPVTTTVAGMDLNGAAMDASRWGRSRDLAKRLVCGLRLSIKCIGALTATRLASTRLPIRESDGHRAAIDTRLRLARFAKVV